jgi:lipopolysaccharide transport protein LptA
MIGQADRLEYREAESTLILLGNAKLSHRGDTIESNTIRINTDNESIQAGSSNSDDRVKMLIQPKQQ